MEQEIKKNEKIHNGGFDMVLRGVLENDFAPTLVFLHKIYFGNELKPEELDRFFRGKILNLYHDLKRDIESEAFNKLSEAHVAYSSHEHKGKLVKDLENTTYETWLKFREDPDYKASDALCAKMFRAYWARLVLRAEIVKSAENNKTELS